LRNQEAARYARMAAMAAGAIVLIVAGIYVQHAVRNGIARRGIAALVPSGVQQESANFTYSDVEQGHTIFTLRASHATQFKQQNRALLDDVWITVYGREGNRNDNIHTRQCSYEPETGGVRCQGEVQIDIQGAQTAPGKAGAAALAQAVEVKTSDLTFNRETGEAETAAPVQFTFAQGQGHGTGIRYSTRDATVRIEHDVEFDLQATDRSGGLPVKATGSSLEIQRDKRVVILTGPAIVQQGNRRLSAGKISITLDKDYRAQEALAEEHPSIQGNDQGGKFSLAAAKFEATLAPEGWVEKLVSEGSVAGMRQSAAGTDRFLAQRVELTMVPERNAIREMLATGGVAAQSQQGSDSRSLNTESLKANFKTEPQQERPSNSGTTLGGLGGQQIESAESLAPATLESKAGNEELRLKTKRFTAEFGAGGRLERLLGHDGVEVRRQIDSGTPQTSSAAELVATFSSSGDWDSIEETGGVHFGEADRQASAAKAKMLRSTGLVTLEGSPVISDAQSRTTAGSVSINQQSGEIHATGEIVSTYLPANSPGSNSELNLGAGDAHISADKLDGSTTAGHATYSGHARLWQGESVLEADEIEIWRDDKKMQARGHVVAVFPQAPGAGPEFGGMSSKASVKEPASAETAQRTSEVNAAKASADGAKPTLWQIRAPSLTYWSDQGKAHLEGGVTAVSEQGSLQSRTLDAFLTPGVANGTTSSKENTSSERSARELNRVLAQGGVVVRQGERQASAEQGEYTAADEKFVLSGGEPTIRDASSDTTTQGRSLTFFVASDTILIDSQEGLRTLTKHRVEK
jgi:LPS export ABC transporter protein LptC